MEVGYWIVGFASSSEVINCPLKSDEVSYISDTQIRWV